MFFLGGGDGRAIQGFVLCGGDLDGSYGIVRRETIIISLAEKQRDSC